jgi:hypothetical protein
MFPKADTLCKAQQGVLVFIPLAYCASPVSEQMLCNPSSGRADTRFIHRWRRTHLDILGDKIGAAALWWKLYKTPGYWFCALPFESKAEYPCEVSLIVAIMTGISRRE